MPDFSRLDAVKRQRPLIHCVSNLVSANDCANLALAIGASPMMAQALPEMEAITAASSATVLNTGTPDEEKFRVCLVCGKAAEPSAAISSGPESNTAVRRCLARRTAISRRSSREDTAGLSTPCSRLSS